MSKRTLNGGLGDVFILPLNSLNRYLQKQQLSGPTNAFVATEVRVYRV
jgi:hypothetical protein